MDSVYVPRKYVPDPTVHGEPPAPFQRSQSMFTDRTRPLPRPPGTYTIYPPRCCGSAQDRIKLGVNAIRSPRNYMNQGPHHEYDSDSTVTNTDHIYETLNLPSDSDNASRAGGSRAASRTGSVHALNHMNQQHLSVHSIDSAPNHIRNASTGSEVFESDSGMNTSTSSFPNSRTFQQHPYGPGYRSSPSTSDSNYGGSSPSDQISNTTARILYPPKSAYNKLNQLRDRNSVLYRPGAQRSQNHNRSTNPNFDRRRPNYSQNHSPNFMDGTSPPSNCIPMQYQGNSQTPRNSTSNNLSVHSPPLQNSSQVHSTPIQSQNMPLSPAQATHAHASQAQQRTLYNPNKLHNHMRPPNTQQDIAQNSSINHQNQRTPPGVHNVGSGRMTNNPVNNNNAANMNNKAMFKPVTAATEHGEQSSHSLSPQWQSPSHDRIDSTVSNNPRDLPTPDSQSNLIPSSNNSSFDQTQRSVIFLSDVDTDHMNPTCV